MDLFLDHFSRSSSSPRDLIESDCGQVANGTDCFRPQSLCGARGAVAGGREGWGTGCHSRETEREIVPGHGHFNNKSSLYLRSIRTSVHRLQMAALSHAGAVFSAKRAPWGHLNRAPQKLSLHCHWATASPATVDSSQFWCTSSPISSTWLRDAHSHSSGGAFAVLTHSGHCTAQHDTARNKSPPDGSRGADRLSGTDTEAGTETERRVLGALF